MAISGIAGAPSLPFVPHSQSVRQADPGAAPAAATLAQQIAAGRHNQHPLVAPPGTLPGTREPADVQAPSPGPAGINTVA
jgi:hypothetical protein